MKKNFKLVLALVLALMMVMGMTSAMAASISINHDGSYDGATGTTARVYSAYKIFDAQYTASLSGTNTQDAKDPTYTPDGAAVSYSIATDSPWLSVMQAAGQTWFDLALAADGSKYIVTPKSGAMTTAAHAKAFGDYLAANIPAGATATDVTVDAATATTVDKGYYLIVGKDTKDAVTRVAVVTTDVEMIEKNTYITTTKTVEQTSYNVGETITYTATVTIPSDTALTETEGTGYKAGHGPVILHDKMDTRLTFGSITGATMDSADFTGYTSNTSPTDGDTFDISIPVTAAVLGKTITFTYTAIINETAVSDTGFINDLFGENNGYKTNKDEVRVYTFDIKLNKTFTGASGNASDYEAKFELRTTADNENTAIKFNQDSSVSTKYVKVDGDTANEGSTELVVHHNETIDMIGLKAGTYYLVETATKDGYNKLDKPIEVVITDTTTDPANPSHTVKYKLDSSAATYTDASEHTVLVNNNKGNVLPSTGGIGTTIFYVAGSILVLAAAILLITKRRMGNND